jgi:exonuclease SbcC
MALTISLERFGCYRTNTSFTFNAPGLALLHGDSGSGKSSILDGIAFALYGNIKRVSWGEDKSKVILEYDDYIITRITGKNKVTLYDKIREEEYKDTEAQDLINEKYGINFSITSYITQDSTETFFNLTPTNRMAFLEKLSLGDIDISGIKKKCKTKISERKSKMNEKVGELKFVLEESSKITAPILVEYPLTGKYSEKRVKNEAIRKKKNIKLISKCRKEVTSLVSKQTAYSLISQQRDELIIQINNTSMQINTLRDELETLPDTEIVAIEDRIKFINLNKELVKLKISYLSDQQQYQAMCTIEEAQMQDEYDSLVKISDVIDISDELREKSKYKEQTLKVDKNIIITRGNIDELDTMDTYISIIEKHRKCEQDLLQLKIETNNRHVVYKCPKCETSLCMGYKNLEYSTQINDDNLKSCEDIDKEIKYNRFEREEYEDSVRELKMFEKKLSELLKDKEKLPVIDMVINYENEYNKHMEDIHNQLSRHSKIDNLTRRIKNKEFDGRNQALARRLELKGYDINKLEMDLGHKDLFEICNKDDIDILQECLVGYKIVEQKRHLLLKQKSQLESHITGLNKRFTDCILEDVNYKDLIDEKKNELNLLLILEKEFNEREILLMAYIAYTHKLETYNNWQFRLKYSTTEEYNARASLATAEKFLRKFHETECAAVINTIDNINQHLDYYLEKFFIDPITVEICPFKETKGKIDKPDINIKAVYKGCECNIKQLSGGERARVELAICLAISAVCGSSLMLFDEIFKSLDATISEDIIDILKLEASEQNKLIIMICHQTNESSFDHIVHL